MLFSFSICTTEIDQRGKQGPAVQPLGPQQNSSGGMAEDCTRIMQLKLVEFCVAVKLVKFPLASVSKVNVKSSPLIVKFIFQTPSSRKDSPVDVRIRI